MKTFGSVLLLLLLAFPSLLPAQTPVGGEIRVATSTAALGGPDVAMSPQGTFVVGWFGSTRRTGDAVAAFGRLYAADGTPRTGEFRISRNVTAGVSRFVRLAMMDDGSFVAVFPLEDKILAARRFTASGTPVGDPFLIPTNELFFSFEVGSRGDGSFVVVWQENFNRIAARVFGTGDEPPGPEIEVWRGTPKLPRVAVGPDGSFLVMWSDIQGSSGTGHFEDLLARVFTAGGAPRGESFSVLAGPPRETGFRGYDTAVDADGSFLVTWFQTGPQPPSTFVRRYAPDGAPLSGPSLAGHRPAGMDIAEDPAGGFVSVWKSPTAFPEVVARQFSESGSPEGPLVLLSRRMQRSLGDLRLAGNGTGSYVAVWNWYGRIGRDALGSAISVRRFRAD